MTTLNRFTLNENELSCPPGRATLASTMPPNLQNALLVGQFQDPCPLPVVVCGVHCQTTLNALSGIAIALVSIMVVLVAFAIVHRVRCRDPGCAPKARLAPASIPAASPSTSSLAAESSSCLHKQPCSGMSVRYEPLFLLRHFS